MEFLKAIYGDKALTFDELVQAINAHNGNEANKVQDHLWFPGRFQGYLNRILSSAVC